MTSSLTPGNPPAGPRLHESTIPLRWNDFDRYGHLNNAQYIEVAQEARLQFGIDEFGRADMEVPPFFLRHLDLDFRMPIEHGDNDVAIVATQVVEIGRTSLTTRQEIKDHLGRVACVIEAVQVAVDLESSRPRPLTAEEIAILDQTAELA